MTTGQQHDGNEKDADRRDEVAGRAVRADRRLRGSVAGGGAAGNVDGNAGHAVPLGPGQGDLRGRADEDDHREDDRQGRAVAQFEVDERVLVHPVDRGEGVGLRPAGGHDVELVEGDHRADDADERGQQDRARRQRQDDAAHALPVAGAVDHRGLGDFAVDRLDGGDEQDHAEADHLPGDRNDHRPQAEIGIGEPGRRCGNDVQVDEKLVDRPDALIEQPVPEQARRTEADHPGQEDDAAGELLQPRVLPGQKGQQEAADHQDRRDEEGVFQREEERRPEGRVAERLRVVGQADESAAAEQRLVGHRCVDQLAERIDGERRHEQQRRYCVEQTDKAGFGGLHLRPRMSSREHGCAGLRFSWQRRHLRS